MNAQASWNPAVYNVSSEVFGRAYFSASPVYLTHLSTLERESWSNVYALSSAGPAARLLQY